MDKAPCQPESGEVRYPWGHQEGLPGGGGLAVKAENLSRLTMLKLDENIVPAGKEDRVGLWQEQVSVLDRSSELCSGSFSASNLLGPRTCQSVSAFSSEKKGQARLHVIGFPFRKRKEKT